MEEVKKENSEYYKNINISTLDDMDLYLKDLEETLTDDNLSNSSKFNEISRKYEEQTKDLRKWSKFGMM